MVVVAMVIGFTSIWILYTTAIDGQRNRLIETAQSRARMMEAVARFDQQYSIEFPGGPIAATISQVTDAHAQFKGFGQTGEFTLARKEGDQIVFLLGHRHHDLDMPKPVPFAGKWAEPMRRALSGLSGTVIGLDYRGAKVLAAYEPVTVLNMGVVAKIDMKEIRGPFLKAVYITGGIALVAIGIGLLLFFYFSEPLVRNLREAKTEAESANLAKTNFLANISHDLRTPLNAIIGFSYIMKEKSFGQLGDSRYDQYAFDIYTSGNFLLDLINDILDLSKAEVGKFELVEKTVDIGDRIRSAVKLNKSQAVEAKVHLNVGVPVDLPSIRGDARILAQILNNLISNAIKFTPENGSVTVLALVNDKKGIDIRVKDTGIGMTRDEVALALKPFTQTNGYVSDEYKGTGLGLTLCDNFVKLHDGQLIIESSPDKGTTVIARFPPERLVLS